MLAAIAIIFLFVWVSLIVWILYQAYVIGRIGKK